MKRAFLLISILVIAIPQTFAQADRVVGYWLTGEGDSQVRIFKATNGKYYGQLSSFEYDAKDKEWQNGSIYDPKSGKTYDCYMWFEGNNYNTLYIKGFVMGIRFLGRETQWTKEAKLREQT